MHQKIIAKQRIILIISSLLLLASIIVIRLLVRQKKILKEDECIRKELNKTEAKVMLLSCSDLSNKEIGGILGLSIYTVNKCRSEINRKIM